MYEYRLDALRNKFVGVYVPRACFYHNREAKELGEPAEVQTLMYSPCEPSPVYNLVSMQINDKAVKAMVAAFSPFVAFEDSVRDYLKETAKAEVRRPANIEEGK